MRKSANKKEVCNTIMRKGKSLDFPGKTEFVDTIHAQEKSLQNGHPKKQITKNTNIWGLY